MLTRFITSQHDHDGCLCMGINILPNLTGELTSPSPHSSSRGADSRESGQRDYSSLPSFPLPPCRLPTPPLHSHLTSWSTNGNRVLSSTIAALSSLPKPHCQMPRPQNLLPSGVVSQSSLHVDRTALTWTHPPEVTRMMNAPRPSLFLPLFHFCVLL